MVFGLAVQVGTDQHRVIDNLDDGETDAEDPKNTHCFLQIEFIYPLINARQNEPILP